MKIRYAIWLYLKQYNVEQHMFNILLIGVILLCSTYILYKLLEASNMKSPLDYVSYLKILSYMTLVIILAASSMSLLLKTNTVSLLDVNKGIKLKTSESYYINAFNYKDLVYTDEGEVSSLSTGDILPEVNMTQLKKLSDIPTVKVEKTYILVDEMLYKEFKGNPNDIDPVILIKCVIKE